MKNLFSIKNIAYFIGIFIVSLLISKIFVKHDAVLAAATLSLALATFLMVVETKESIKSNVMLENQKLDNEQ